MTLLYNLLQITGLILLSPLLFVKTILSAKYRDLVPRRLGRGLSQLLSRQAAGQGPRIWIHALSVGEVNSALPLVKALRQQYKAGTIIFSTTTQTGEQLARQRLTGQIDLQIPFPLDLFWVSRRFINQLRPDLFILVETDFWPNFLAILKHKNIPALLVNGRISADSFRKYSKLRLLFRPLFSSFTFLSMQTATDVAKMRELGIAATKVAPLGNLKYDAALPQPMTGLTNKEELIDRLQLEPHQTFWVAGSTHAGEEDIILKVFKDLLGSWPNLVLIVAPRQVDRAPEISNLAKRLGLSPRLRSTEPRPADPKAQLVILDTIGELAATYGLADIAFVGGSLVAAGGHNPLEAAVFNTPVLFGPHMEDFAEIAVDLAAAQEIKPVTNQAELFTTMHTLLSDRTKRQTTGQRARALIKDQQGVTARHLKVIDQILIDRQGTDLNG